MKSAASDMPGAVASAPHRLSLPVMSAFGVSQAAECIIYSARSFTQKATGAIGVIVGGAILDLIAFPSGAKLGTVPAGTIWWLGFAEGPGTSVFTIVGVLFYMRYRIDRQRHAQIVRELAANDRPSTTE